MKTQKFWILTAIISTLLALVTHGYLTAQNYRLKSGMADSKSMCNINSQFNCDAVALSKYSEVLGIPVAVWGIATNAVLLLFLIILLLRFSINSGRVAQFNFYLSALVLGASVVMGALSITQLGTYCLFCIAAYVLSAVQAFASYQTLMVEDEAPKNRMSLDITGTIHEQKWILGVIVLVPAIAWLGNRMGRDAFGQSLAPHLISESVAFWKTNATQNFNVNEGLSYTIGNPEQAKMTIVEFADFMCSHCKMAATPLHIFTESRPDVRLIFKPYPLDGTCNASITQKRDGYRCRLAGATLCAQSLKQKGWVAHDWIFERQSELSSMKWDADLASIAIAIGATTEELKACVDSPATQELLLRLSAEGAAAKIQGTPTIFVNGKKLDSGQFVQVLEGVYDSL